MTGHDGERMLAGALFGILVCYLFGALVVWDLHPGHWSALWRLWCVLWAVPWACMSATIAAKHRLRTDRARMDCGFRVVGRSTSSCR